MAKDAITLGLDLVCPPTPLPTVPLLAYLVSPFGALTDHSVRHFVDLHLHFILLIVEPLPTPANIVCL
jgi:hypothetical protein